MTQDGRAVLDAMVWSVGDVAGLEHEDTTPPDVPDPDQARRREEFQSEEEDGPRFSYWGNFDERFVNPTETWPPDGPLPPRWLTWVRPLPRATFDDPWVDGARTLIVLDVGSWPAGSRPHAYLEPPFVAPSLDLYASFQYPGSSSEWMLIDAHSPVSQGGLLSWTGRVWSKDRRLIANGGGQAVFRHT
jgi:acyl-CoA thioesterase-2